MNLARPLAILIATASLGAHAHAQANAFLAWEDARSIRRVATVAGKGMPEELLTKMSRTVVESLRGKQAGGTWQWADYVREEAAKTEDSFGLKPRKGEENPAPVTLTGTLGYKVRLAVPSRRYLVARNREVEIQRAIVEYTNDKGETLSEEFPEGLKLEPGQHTELELKNFGWSPIVRVWAFSDEKLGKKASLTISISEPKLVDDPKSPYFGAVQQAQALPKAIDREDAAEIRKLCDSIIATIEGVHPEASARVNALVTRGEAPPSGTVPAPQALPSGIDKLELNRQLQEIEDLLTGTEAERAEGLSKLRQLVRSTRP